MKLLTSFEFGCPTQTTGTSAGLVDIIEYFDRRSPRIIEKVGPLYLKGLSITDIHKQTGIPRSSIYAYGNKVELLRKLLGI